VILGILLIVIEHVAFSHSLNARQAAAIIQTNEGDALRGAPHLANLGDPCAYQDPAIGDQHDLIGWLHQHGANEITVALARLNCNHALGTTAMTGVFADRCAFAESILGCRQNAVVFAFGDQHGNDALPFFQVHAAHAAGIATHGPYIVLV